VATLPTSILMRASHVSAFHNCSFEQFLHKKIASVYRSVNYYWKKRYNSLLDEYNTLKSKLSEPLILIPEEPIAVNIEPTYSQTISDKPLAHNETVDIVLELNGDLPDLTDKFTETKGAFLEYTGDFPEITEPHPVLPDGTELIENHPELVNDQSSANYELGNFNSNSPRLDLPLAHYKILKNDKRNKRCLVKFTRGQNSRNMDFDYSDEEELIENINEFRKIELATLCTSIQNIFTSTKKRKPKPKQKFNYKKKRK